MSQVNKQQFTPRPSYGILVYVVLIKFSKHAMFVASQIILTNTYLPGYASFVPLCAFVTARQAVAWPGRTEQVVSAVVACSCFTSSLLTAGQHSRMEEEGRR